LRSTDFPAVPHFGALYFECGDDRISFFMTISKIRPKAIDGYIAMFPPGCPEQAGEVEASHKGIRP
jgi:hypothetical protein